MNNLLTVGDSSRTASALDNGAKTPDTAVTPEQTGHSSRLPKPGAERRRYPRYSFDASAEFLEIVESESGNKIESAVTELGQRGCFLRTERTLPVGTPSIIRIRKGEKTLALHASVVYSDEAKGMGLEFSRLAPEDVHTLEKWLSESREKAWRESTRRRGQRLVLRIKVRVSGQINVGEAFQEETSTLSASPHGASVLLAAPVSSGQRVNLLNLTTNAEVECLVAHVGKREGDYVQVGLAFANPKVKFWHIAFPPEDWTPRHPDARQIG